MGDIKINIFQMTDPCRRMRYKNETNVPDRVIQAVIKAVSHPKYWPSNLKIVLYDFRPDRHIKYGFLQWDPKRIRSKAVVYLPRNDKVALSEGVHEKPFDPSCSRRTVFKTRIEALVTILAHELRHADQYISRTVLSDKEMERDAWDYSKKMLRLFRRGKILANLQKA